jgi:hypothetical protein
MDHNSILNVFPLSNILDLLIGFWDSQKIRAAEKMSGVYYVDLKTHDVFRWYREESHGCGRESPTLLAADGIHPNSKCYEKWAKFVGNTFIDRHVLAKEETPSFN